MTLATRCPRCGTVYRLVADQLKPHHGLVRCGHCQEIFDGARHVVEPLTLTDAATEDAHETRPAGDAGAARAGAETTPPADQDDAHVQSPAPSESARPSYAASPNWDPWSAAPGSRVEPSLHMPDTTRDNSDLAATGRGRAHGSAATREEPTVTREPATAGEPAATREPAAAAEPAATREEPTVTREPAAAGEPTATREAPAAAREGATAREPARPGKPGTTHEPTIGPEPGTAYEPMAAPAPAAATASAATAEAPAPLAGRAENFAVTREKPAHTDGGAARALGWIVALLLAMVLIAQLAWWQREKIVTLWPRTQPLYRSACAQLGCAMTPPRDIDGLAIEQTSLRQIDGPHRLELRFTLRNHDGVALAYPALELTLLDRDNQIAARRVLWPQEYLAPGTPPQAGVPALGTLPVATRLDTGNLDAANYRVQIFYP